MVALYLASLIFGGGLLAVSLFAGGNDDIDSDAEFDTLTGLDHEVDADIAAIDFDSLVDFGHDIDVDIGADLNVHADMDTDHDLNAAVDTDTDADYAIDDGHTSIKDLQHYATGRLRGQDFFIILSLRFWTFFLAFFGAAGVLLTSLTALPVANTAAAAAATGFACGAMGSGLVKYFMRDEADSSLKAKDLVGRVGRITVRCRSNASGKVLIEFEDSVREFLAVSDDGELAVGTQVLLTFVGKEGVVRVTSHNRS